MTCINANIMNKLFISNECAMFLQNWFHIDIKMMKNFVQKKSFHAKPLNCCERELTVSWKP